MEIKERKTQSGYVWRFVNEFENTRSGFNHKTTLFKGAGEVLTHKAHYINRTWECYTYQTSMRGAVRTLYESELARYIENYKYANEITRLKKGDKERLENEYKETDEGKDLLELLDCIEKRDFDRTSM